MKHKNMLKGHDEKIIHDKGINCKGKVIYLHNSFYSDVNWEIYYCPECDSVVSYISDGHNWNYTHNNPLESSLEKGRLLSHNPKLAKYKGLKVTNKGTNWRVI